MMFLIFCLVDLEKIFIFLLRLCKNFSKINLFTVNFFNKNINLFSILIFLVFSASSVNLQNIDILGSNFETKNLLLTYLLWRFLFLITMTLAIMAVGNIIFTYLKNKETNTNDSFEILIFSLAYGILFFSILGVVLGFIGYLKTSINYVIVSLILLFSGKILNFKNFQVFINFNSQFSLNSNIFILNLTRNTAAFSVLTFILFKILTPLEYDGDFWGHYINYFNDVKSNSKIYVSNYWYHFVLSKGAGLFYFFNSLSDLLTPQIVSGFCILFSSLIISDFVLRLTKESIWAMISVILFITSLYAISPLNLFKHHVVFMTLLLIIFWSINALLYNNKNEVNINLLLYITSFYIGFFLPTISLILFICLNVTILYFYFYKRNNCKTIFYSNCLLCFGVFLSLAINFLYTGILEIVMSDLFWQFSNQVLFKETLVSLLMNIYLFR